jgi:hypothetical protein
MTIADQLSKLAALGLWALEETRAENIGSDLDGGSVQDKAEALGLLQRIEVTEDCGGGCTCVEYGDFPQDCLRATYEPDSARAALAAYDAAPDDDAKDAARYRWLRDNNCLVGADHLNATIDQLIDAARSKQ